MKIRLVWITAGQDAEYEELIERYFSRIKHFFPIERVEVAPEKSRQNKSDVAIMHADSARLMEALPPRGSLVVLDQRGDLMDSLKFAKWFERLTTQESHGVNFVVGGDVGLDDAIRARADKLLALSPMTLPHQLARVVLLEQIYRACTIIRNIRYHK
jgi:23S rRNA (pseudouridine1915-N3)-methyltransferase